MEGISKQNKCQVPLRGLNIQMSQLEQLINVARYESLAYASRKMFMSQSALSRSIKQLEEKIGCGLFDHTANKIELNTEGRIVADYAECIMLLLENMMRDVDLSSRSTSRITLASCSQDALTRFESVVRHINASVNSNGFVCGSNDILINRLLHDECDAIILNEPMEREGLACVALTRCEMSVIVPDSSSLAKRSTLSFGDIDGLPVVAAQDNGVFPRIIEKQLPHSAIAWVENAALLLRRIETGDTLSLFVDGEATKHNFPGHVSVPIVDGDAHMNFYVIAKDTCCISLKNVMKFLHVRRTKRCSALSRGNMQYEAYQ